MFSLGGPIDKPIWVCEPHSLNIYPVIGFKARLFGLHAWQYWGAVPRAMLFTNCNSIHTFGLKQNIDIVFFNYAMQIIGSKAILKPNKITSLKTAKHILELPAGYCLNQNCYQQILNAKFWW